MSEDDDRTEYVRGPGLKTPTRAPQQTPGRTRIPCPWPNCRCTHTDGCVAGWLEDGEGRAVPCPVCRPRQAAALTDPNLSHDNALWKLRHPKEGDH